MATIRRAAVDVRANVRESVVAAALAIVMRLKTITRDTATAEAPVAAERDHGLSVIDSNV